MEGKWPRDLLPKAGWATSRVYKKELWDRSLCPDLICVPLSSLPHTYMMGNLSLLLFLLLPVPGLLGSSESLCFLEEVIDRKIKQGFSSLLSEAITNIGIQCRTVSSRGELASCPEGLSVTSCSCGSACGSWDVREGTTCHCQCAGIDWTAARCCALGVGMCGHLGGSKPNAVVIYLNQPSRMQASASRDKNRRKPGHNEGAHNPDYENITLAFRNKDQLKLSQSAPIKEAQFKPSLNTTQPPPWLHRTIMILYILLALIFLSYIVLSALVLVKNSEMSRELWSLKEELSNVSNIVLNCQDQQMDHWKAVQKSTQEAKSKIAVLSNSVQSGNEKLKMVPADITQIKKILEALEKKALAQPSSK